MGVCISLFPLIFGRMSSPSSLPCHENRQFSTFLLIVVPLLFGHKIELQIRRVNVLQRLYKRIYIRVYIISEFHVGRQTAALSISNGNIIEITTQIVFIVLKIEWELIDNCVTKIQRLLFVFKE